jgi:hypothetical protein
MKKPKLNFYRLGIALKIQKAKEVVNRMTGNANFTTPNPALAVLTAAINALEAAYEAAADGGKTLTATMHAKEAILDGLMAQLEDYISSVSAGDILKIQSSGFEVRDVSLRGKRKASVVSGENPGEVVCTAEAPAKGVKAMHEYQFCNDPIPADTQSALTNPWLAAEISSLSMVTVSNLTGGAKLWFRHRHILTKGQKSPWKILGSVIVPK